MMNVSLFLLHILAFRLLHFRLGGLEGICRRTLVLAQSSGDVETIALFDSRQTLDDAVWLSAGFGGVRSDFDLWGERLVVCDMVSCEKLEGGEYVEQTYENWSGRFAEEFEEEHGVFGGIAG
jgi:hypothetical protein